MVTKHIQMADALLRHHTPYKHKTTPSLSLLTIPFVQWLFEGIRAGHFSSIIYTQKPYWRV